MTSEQIALRVIDVLNGGPVSYMLVGSLCTNFHSVPRATDDADIVIQTEVTKAARLVAAQCPELCLNPQFGFESVMGTKKLVLRAEAEDFDVELFGLSDDLHDQERFRRRLVVEWEGRTTWIATAEDAIVMKLRWGHLAGRRKDLVDVSAMIAFKGEKLDWPYIEGWCDQHGSRSLLEQLRAELR